MESNSTSTVNVASILQGILLQLNISPRVQEDAHETLLNLVDSIDRSIVKTSTEGSKQLYSDLFLGSIRTAVKCSHVNETSSKDSPLLDISLSLPSQQEYPKLLSLDVLLSSYFSQEILEGDNRYRSKEHGLQVATKSTSLLKAPAILVVHFQRFSWNRSSQSAEKENANISFPLILELNANSSIPKYSLRSVVVHEGNANYGHYMAIVRESPRNVLGSSLGKDLWILYNDHIASPIDLNELHQMAFGGQVGSSNAYLLFYEQSDN